MKIRELTAMVEQDCRINPTDLTGESLKVPYLQGKYINLFFKEKSKLKALEYKLKDLMMTKTTYYSGKSHPSVYIDKPLHVKVLRAQVHLYVETDPDVVSHIKERDIQQMIVDLIGDMKQTLNQRSFHISNAIKHKLFINGE